jgi:hypothetical protein
MSIASSSAEKNKVVCLALFVAGATNSPAKA